MPLVSERIPRWRSAIAVVLLVAIFGTVLFLARQGTSVQRAVDASNSNSGRNDCRAVIQAARRDVIDRLSLTLDVDRTSHDQLLGEALLGSRLPTPRGSDAIVADYLAVYDKLTMDRALAQALPSELPDVDTLVNKGGWMPTLAADGTVGRVHFDPCPQVG